MITKKLHVKSKKLSGKINVNIYFKNDVYKLDCIGHWCAVVYEVPLQRRIQNSEKHLRWSFFGK